MKKTISSLIISLLGLGYLAFAGTYELKSPNGQLLATITVEEDIRWSATYKRQTVIENVVAAMHLPNDLVLGQSPEVADTHTRTVDQMITATVPTKSSQIQDHYNELILYFAGDYEMHVRAYDNGIAYRFATTMEGEIKVLKEKMEIYFKDDVKTFFPLEEHPNFISHYERTYIEQKISEFDAGSYASLPTLFQTPTGVEVLVTESDVFDYPHSFLFATGSNWLQTRAPKAITKTQQSQSWIDRNEDILEEAEYIARTQGDRTFPWRIFAIGSDDKALLENNLVYQLARTVEIEDTSWIKPGLVAWDWWNDWNLTGVDFEAGINNTTYKYYIDFAAEYGLDYIILDEGWSASTTNILEYKEDIDVAELVEYGKDKGVDVILWVLWKPLDDNLIEALDLYQSWGVKGIKVDFMQRADQYMVNYYERVADECAKREMIVDYHGAFKPAGLRRAYPNVVSYEGLKGLEVNKWGEEITPPHNVLLPFIRMVAGPMDYTPGAMDNAHPDAFIARNSRPMSQGTRAHQVAMYALYESPLQMLADTPSNYKADPECTAFIAQFPTTWDETKALEAEVGKYVVVARRKGEQWFIGAMTDWEEREFDLDLSFAGPTKYNIQILEDGPNALKNATDYRLTEMPLESRRMRIKLSQGGGWAAILTPASR